MNENIAMVAVGVILIIVSVSAKSVSYGMPPHSQKPKFPIGRPLRVALLSLGLLSIALGLVGFVRK